MGGKDPVDDFVAMESDFVVVADVRARATKKRAVAAVSTIW
jgi:hypothetical protein